MSFEEVLMEPDVDEAASMQIEPSRSGITSKESYSVEASLISIDASITSPDTTEGIL